MNYEGMIYRPPSEARSFILQVTVGCAHNDCTFCAMYKDKKFHIKSMELIRQDVQEAYGLSWGAVNKIFLADGDALVLSNDKLLEIIGLCRKHFPHARITSYASTQDVLRKSAGELSELLGAGLEMVYLGAETGSDEILRHVKKGVTSAEIIEASGKLRAAGIKNSMTLISGIGGKKHLSEHAHASARLVSEAKPDYLGFLTLYLADGAPMLDEVRSGEMELLTPPDVVREMELFLESVDSQGTVFRANHASNYVTLKGNLNDDIPAMIEKLELAKKTDWYKVEGMRGL